MSNELFMELFEYFDLYSLYLTFYSLNSRFNSIICHCQVHVNLNQINPLYFTSFIGQFVYLNIDKGRICTLQSSIPHQVAVLVNDIVNKFDITSINFYVGYFRSRFEFFLNGFAQSLDQVRPKLDQDITRWALSNELVIWSNQPFYPEEKSKILQKT